MVIQSDHTVREVAPISSFKTVPIQTYLLDTALQQASHLFACLCLASCGLLLMRSRSRLGRVIAAAACSAVLLLFTPLIYSSPTQPLSIALASLYMMAVWTMLDWAFLQTAGPTSATQVLHSLLLHVLSGVKKVHQRRIQAQAQQQADVSQSGGTVGIAAGPATGTQSIKHRKPRAAHINTADRPVVHIDAGAGPSNIPDAATQAAPELPLVKLRRNHKSGEGLSTDFKPHPEEATTQLTQYLTCQLDALLVLSSLIVAYDIYYAVLCCGSGCMCRGISQEHMAGNQGLLGRLLPPRLAYYVFSALAGMLLPMQMSCGYAWMRVFLCMGGDVQLADSLPPHAFNRPYAATSVGDLWGDRWHAFLRYYFQGLGYKLADFTVAPLLWLLPNRMHKYWIFNWRTLTVFAMSGVLHEYIAWAAWGIITGTYMAYFMLHGIALLAETYARSLFPGVTACIPPWLSRVLTLCFTTLLSPLFTEPYRQHGYFAHTFHQFMFPVTGSILQWAGLCSCNM